MWKNYCSECIKKGSATPKIAIMILAIWNVLHYVSHSPAIPSMTSVINAIMELPDNEKFGIHLVSTTRILLYGILTGATAGFVLGAVIDISAPVKAVVSGVVHFMRGIPAIALFPLILAVLGIGDSSRIAVIIWTAFPPVFISTVYGMQSVDKDVIGAASLDGANRIDIAVRVKIPMALCEIMNGIKIAIGTGFISVVTAEMLGANKGIGYMILWSTNAFKYAEVYAYIFVVAVMGFIMSLAMETLTKFLEKRIYQ